MRGVGMSPEQDMFTGGSSRAFTRIQNRTAPDSYRVGRLVFQPRVLRDADNLIFDADQYGDASEQAYLSGTRGTGHQAIDKDNVTGQLSRLAGNTENETAILDGVAFDDLYSVPCFHERDRQKIIKLLQERGYTDLGGRPLEEVVVVGRLP